MTRWMLPLLVWLLVACGGDLLDGMPIEGDRADPAAAALDEGRLERLNAWVEELVAEGEIAGAQVMLARHDQVVHEARFGTMGIDSDRPIPSDALWRIYSMTKPVTSVAVMLLYEDGLLGLDDPVADYLPEFETMKVMDADGELRPASATMSIRHLLTHTAGLSYGFSADAPLDGLYREADLFASEDLAEFSQRVAALPLAFEPGSRWHYGVATDVLGRLVEVVSGQSLAEFLEQRLFAPLGMDSTAFQVLDADLERFTANHGWDDDAGLVQLPEERAAALSRFQDVTLYSGGGGLVSTAEDYMRFARMLLNGGSLDGVRIMSPATVRWMHLDHLPVGRQPGQGLDGYGEEVGFGLGFGVINDPARGSSTVASQGQYWWGGAAGTYFWIDPELELVAVLMLQRMQSPDDWRLRFRALVLAALND